MIIDCHGHYTTAPPAHEAWRKAGAPELNPLGWEGNRRNLEVALGCLHRQGLVSRRYAVDELIDDATRTLNA